MKEVKIIIRLNNAHEAKYLVSKGVKFGENGLHVTTSNHNKKRYYLCTNRNNLYLLNKYRESIGITK